MDAQILEFDHFGPWVLEIAATDPAPSLFVPYLVRHEQPILAVKVPRRIDRRDARPGMDLYDYLVCLYADDLEIMHREGRTVRRWACPYRDIGRLSVTRMLLHGNVHLEVPGGACDLPFNTTADRPIERIIELVRDRYQAPLTANGPPAETDLTGAGLSFYFEHLLADLRREHPALRPLALQGTVALGGRHGTALSRSFFRATGKRLLESMHLSDGRELVILDRGADYAYRWEAVYGQVTSYVPLVAIRAVDWRDDAASRITTLTIRTDGGAVSYPFTQDDPSIGGYRTWLSGLPASRSPGPAGAGLPSAGQRVP